jgi:hypothetical protein
VAIELSEDDTPTPEQYDEDWLGEISPETERFLYKVFYPLIGFKPKAKTEESWRRNMKVLLDWGSIEWRETDKCTRLRKPPEMILRYHRRTLEFPEEYVDRKDLFFGHLEEASTSLGYDTIFPLGTEDRVWDWFYWETQSEGAFEALTKRLVEEFGPLPYVRAMVARDLIDRINETTEATDVSAFIDKAVLERLEKTRN